MPLQPTSRGSGKTLPAVGGNYIVQYDGSSSTFFLQWINSQSQPSSEKTGLTTVDQLSTDGTNICATFSSTTKCGTLRLNNGNRVWKTTTNNFLSTAMTANSMTMFGLNNNKNLNRAAVAGITSGTVSWSLVTAPAFTKIAYDGKRVCGIKTDQSIVCTTSNLTSLMPPTWSAPLPQSNWKSLALSNDNIYAVSSTNSVQRIAAPIL
ncbi:hypothetical protein SDRG_15019 [Saprolegnia diclina VS20]|uniref:Uncharacterized protein n=1 Tax=Saprolegnia diclina (strain VS20) TaxID=1156394 RepID=T0RC85_SAPDV|nr:hypothetical protein SDRG_15019 [Saprolegnia diclina VS20]EQC27217.1 hypothetical protein SDRG_15019 [Saprolegnia diclina VS20]|eukprot:XP_008619404.1 hypothetical protein SDRG_15019 [Saprolegnia diclina VS20]